MELGRANLEVFADTLLELGRENPDLLVVTGDSRGSGKLVPFGQKLPDQIVEIGIAEQNLVGVSAGLASAGKIVFAVSPASFLTTRSFEQVKNDIAYSDIPVKVIGISAGVSYGALGSTHHSLHDFAALLAVNNIDIVIPADNFETREAIRASMDYPYPVYIRFGKKPLPHLHDPATTFEIGKAIVLSTGSDITFIATGETVFRAVQASKLLEEQGVSCGVISMHTLKPLDRLAITEAAQNSRAIITVEEHSVYGGLGSLCSSLMLQEGLYNPFKIVGIPDEYTVTGSQAEILSHYGISAAGLASTALQVLEVEKSL
jgi:transketolase